MDKTTSFSADSDLYRALMAYIVDSKMSQREVAEKLGIHEVTLSRWRKRGAIPSNNCLRVANFLKNIGNNNVINSANGVNNSVRIGANADDVSPKDIIATILSSDICESCKLTLIAKFNR